MARLNTMEARAPLPEAAAKSALKSILRIASIIFGLVSQTELTRHIKALEERRVLLPNKAAAEALSRDKKPAAQQEGEKKGKKNKKKKDKSE